jgi:hypothetical protein
LPPTNSKPPSITGPTLVGKTIKASTGDWLNSPTSYAYAWARCDAAGANCKAITGASSPTYLIEQVDAGTTLIVTVIASNKAGSASASSDPTSNMKSTGPSK